MYDVDVIVIGAGVAGIHAAKTCAGAGLDVCVIEKGPLGGSSIHGGGTFFHHVFQSVKMLENIRHHDAWKIKTELKDMRFDFSGLMDEYGREAAHMEQRFAGDFDALGITRLAGEAVLKDEHTVRIGEKTLSATFIILAHGARMRIPDVSGIRAAMDEGFLLKPEGIMSLRRTPESMCVLGGGRTAFEIADFFTRLGTHVTLLSDRGLMEDIDADARDVFIRKMRHEHLDIVEDCQALRFKDGRLMIETRDDSHTVACDLAVLASGFQLNRGVLGAVDIRTEPSGIITNDALQTNIPHIYAVGDANDKIKLSNVAIEEGKQAARHILGKETSIDYDTFVHGLMGVYEYAYIGRSEQAIEASGEPYHVHTFDLSRDNDRFRYLDTPLVKLCLSKRNHAILGLHIVGESGTEELIHLHHALETASFSGDLGLPIYTRMQRIKEQVDAIKSDYVDHLIRHALFSVYQPIVDNDTHAVVGHETLSRFMIDGEARSPLPSIRMLERTGHIVSLDLKTIENAGKTLQAIKKRGDGKSLPFISVNISSVTLNTEPLKSFTDRLSKAGAAPADIVIEVTERQIIDDERLMEKLRALKAAGFRIALDDFSMGHASLPLINRFSFDIVKLDRALLPVDGDDEGSIHTYRYLTRLLDDRSVEILAEGVETPWQAQFLASLPVDHLQGFLFGQPKRL